MYAHLCKCTLCCKNGIILYIQFVTCLKKKHQSIFLSINIFCYTKMVALYGCTIIYLISLLDVAHIGNIYSFYYYKKFLMNILVAKTLFVLPGGFKSYSSVCKPFSVQFFAFICNYCSFALTHSCLFYVKT